MITFMNPDHERVLIAAAQNRLSEWRGRVVEKVYGGQDMPATPQTRKLASMGLLVKAGDRWIPTDAGFEMLDGKGIIRQWGVRFGDNLPVITFASREDAERKQAEHDRDGHPHGVLLMKEGYPAGTWTPWTESAD